MSCSDSAPASAQHTPGALSLLSPITQLWLPCPDLSPFILLTLCVAAAPGVPDRRPAGPAAQPGGDAEVSEPPHRDRAGSAEKGSRAGAGMGWLFQLCSSLQLLRFDPCRSLPLFFLLPNSALERWQSVKHPCHCDTITAGSVGSHFIQFSCPSSATAVAKQSLLMA